MTKEEEVELVKKTIKKLDYPTPDKLLESLKGKVTQEEFDKILGYLLRTNHILINNGDIVWTWNPKVADRIFSNKELLIK